MSDVAKRSDKDPSRQLRRAFPQVCKWFQSEGSQPTSEQAASEVEERFQRLQENNISPCENCPLCPGHE